MINAMQTVEATPEAHAAFMALTKADQLSVIELHKFIVLAPVKN